MVMRTIREEDIAQISEIEKEVFTDPWSHEMLLESSKSYRCWMIESPENDLILGYLMGEKVLDEFMIYNVAVRKNYQHQGLGTILTKKVLELMKAEGCRKFFLEVRKSNVNAQSLYKNLGFEELYIRKNYYHEPTEDALVMMLIYSIEEVENENL